MTDGAAKPRPVPDESSAGYWAAAAKCVLALPRCAACGRATLPPTTVCPACGTSDPRFTFEPVEGGGTVRSWTVVRDAFLPGFSGDVPYLLVDVELDAAADVRMIGRLVDGPGADLHIGDRVAVTFDEIAPGVLVPAFVLSEQ